MKKLILSGLFLLLCTMVAMAQSTLNVHTKSGSVVSYNFSEEPTVTYTADGLHLQTKTVDVDYPLDDLDKFTFSKDEATGIATTKGTSDDVRIYTLNGVLVHTAKAENGKSSFSMSSLPAGIYVVKNGNITYKITKR